MLMVLLMVQRLLLMATLEDKTVLGWDNYVPVVLVTEQSLLLMATLEDKTVLGWDKAVPVVLMTEQRLLLTTTQGDDEDIAPHVEHEELVDIPQEAYVEDGEDPQEDDEELVDIPQEDNEKDGEDPQEDEAGMAERYGTPQEDNAGDDNDHQEDCKAAHGSKRRNPEPFRGRSSRIGERDWISQD